MIAPMRTFASWDVMRADYDAAKQTKFRRRKSGVPSMGAGADWHYRNESEFLRIIEWARDFDRNSPLVAQGLDRAVANIHSDTYQLDPDTGDLKLDDELKYKFNEWANDRDACDITGERTLREIAAECLRHVFLDGDCLVLPILTGELDTVEAHRMRSPSRSKNFGTHGVKVNTAGKPLSYYVTKQDFGFGGGSIKVDDIQTIETRDTEGHRQAFHLRPRRRMSQYRGVSALAPVFDMIGFHDDLQFAQLIKAQISSCFVIFHQLSATVQGLTGNSPAKGSQETETLSDGQSRLLENIGPGMEIVGRPGAQLTGFSPNVPNSEFFEHVKMVLTFISINLGLPLQVLLLDPSETNFSGWRGAIDQARQGFRIWQKWFIENFYCEIYRWKVRQWILEEPLIAKAAERERKPVKIYKHWWKPPAWNYIEPNKDAAADVLRMSTLLASPRRVHSDKGQDFFEEARHSIEDYSYAVGLAIEAAKNLNTKYPDNPDKITWRDVYAMPLGEGVSQSIVRAIDADSEKTDGQKTAPKPAKTTQA